jgi:hypothetical protein
MHRRTDLLTSWSPVNIRPHDAAADERGRCLLMKNTLGDRDQELSGCCLPYHAMHEGPVYAGCIVQTVGLRIHSRLHLQAQGNA